MRHSHRPRYTYACPFSTGATGETDSDTETLRQRCLAVLRTIAQPVSVLTTLNWEHEQIRSGNSSADPVSFTTEANSPPKTNTPMMNHPSSWHGATLSSFTSIAMYPYPLISFSLRTPARMADLLRPFTEKNSTLNTSTTPKIHLVINLLASHQSHLAIHFSHPRDLRAPFESSSPVDIQYTTTTEGIPILHNTLGALCCTLIKSIPLDTIYPESTVNLPSVRFDTPTVTSELFIARVMHVLPSHEPFGEELSPLVYHKQRYSTVK